jgi:hypothetical protein
MIPGLLCGFCKFAAPFVEVPAVFIVNGQSVCEDHIDAAAAEHFHDALYRLNEATS